MLSSQSISAGSERHRPPLNRRRDKPQLSCNLCRRRKLRCDRQQPCQTCSHRGLPCTYANNGPASAGIARHNASSRPQMNLQTRLSQLEDLVISIMDNSSPADENLLSNDLQGSSLDHPISRELAHKDQTTLIDNYENSSKTPESGSIRVSASESRYVGTGHWASILDSIAELKDHLEAEEETQTSSAASVSLSTTDDYMEMPLLYNNKPISIVDIVGSIPSKQIVDRYISYYFNSLDFASGAVHTGKFLREYERFWQSPSETPVMWLGLLYSIMCMAAMASNSLSRSETDDPTTSINHYREKTAQCLLMGRYANGGPYTWETLYQYVIIELSSRRDVASSIGILHGIAMNLILQMGYHRDPSHFPSISPFDGEIRRRSWVKSIEGDLQMAMRTGMPRRIVDGHWDTEEPRNLHDSDFDEDSKELPPSRPESEMTIVLQLIGRRRMLVAVGAAVDLSTSVKPVPYSEVLAVDRKIQEAEESLPAPLKIRSLEASITDPPQLIFQRFYLALMFRTGELMIHRKYLSVDTEKDSFSYSRKKCLDACLSILTIQHTLGEETAVGGLLHPVSSRLYLTGNHYFLTACMTLCVVVHRGLSSAGNDHAQAREEDIKNALKKSLNAWRQRESTSREAHIAAESISHILKKSVWMEEVPPSAEQPSLWDNVTEPELFGGLLWPEADTFIDAPFTMYGNEWDGGIFSWFADSSRGGI
ncbi:fungal specific transcription factor [Colletotrichum truncatum]|uniref:Fungal specific transcription factor n=1 Tax=Colletotrichum truncatum TaxID=5467 RepID=A0ACC3YG60_COLTU|nr:fungal specific transcription factor [Colletotrichum truncatum]KAF6780766.1 fungal specific transcription factor [Colletotrichum truncatum]